MLSIQNLREQRAAKAKTLSELVNKIDWKPETDQPIYDTGMAEIDAIDASIKRISDVNEKVANEAINNMAIESLEKSGKDTKSKGAKLYAKWLRGGDNGLNAEEWTHIRNTMSTGTGSQGGFTVQTDVVKSLLDALKAYGAMRSVATVLTMAQGNPIGFPASDGTAEVGEWIGENTTATALDPSFSTIPLVVYKASSKVVAVPFELLQDSSIDIEAFVRMRLATRLGRITNTGYTIGTGTAQPTGIMVGSTNGVTAANATSQVTAITYASIIALIHSVDPAYRALNNCRFMMHDSSVKVLRNILDSQNRPIFVPGWDATRGGAALAAPDMLCGYPLLVNQDVAVMAASAKSMLFGDISYYNIRDVMDISMFRFTDSAYTKLGQVGFLAWMRTGGNLIDVGGAVKTFINAAS